MILQQDMWIKGIRIPKGFECDLISFPFSFLNNDPRTFRAALFHDFGYRRDLYGDRAWWDRKFRQLLVEDGMGYVFAWTAYSIVRTFGWYKWNIVRNKKL